MDKIFDKVEDCIAAIANGEVVIVADDENRENECDLIMSGAKATPKTINLMIQYARGLICAPNTEPQLKRLNISPMVPVNTESYRTAFTISVDAAEGITTGISAYDRARTINLLSSDESKPSDLVQPGHIFPLCAKPGGVLQRAGHTEATVDLTQLAGLHPGGVCCEITNDDGSMARLPDGLEFKHKFGLKMISVAQLIEYRFLREKLISFEGEMPFESEYGHFTLKIFKSIPDGRKHIALCRGQISPEKPILVRVQKENLLNDLFRAKFSGSANSLETSLEMIAKSDAGVVLYISNQDSEEFLVPTQVSKAHPSLRDFGIGAQILANLGATQIRLISNTSKKVIGLESFGINIVEEISI